MIGVNSEFKKNNLDVCIRTNNREKFFFDMRIIKFSLRKLSVYYFVTKWIR